MLFVRCSVGRLHDGHLGGGGHADNIGEGQLEGLSQVGHCGGGLSDYTIKNTLLN